MRNQRLFRHSRGLAVALLYCCGAPSLHAAAATNGTSTAETKNVTSTAGTKNVTLITPSQRLPTKAPSPPIWSPVPSVPTLPPQKPPSSQQKSANVAGTARNGTAPSSPVRSDAPSAVPTAEPSSQAPSSAPSPNCHDLEEYRSPLSNRTCSDHIGTDCIQWRYLGLNATEVDALVNSCPVSCRIECGRFAGFHVQVEFVVENVHNYLSPESDAVMERVGVEYLTNYANRLYPDSSIFLYEAELLSQDMVSLPASSLGNTSTIEPASYPDSTGADGDGRSTTNLVATIVYRGYGVDVHQTNATSIVVDGINSLGYSRAIQRSGDPELMDVIITTDLEEALLNRTTPAEEAEQDQAETADHGVSSATIAGVTAVCVLLVCAALVGAIWYKRLGRRPGRPATSFSSAAAMQVETHGEDVAIDIISPAHSRKSSSSNIPTLSFEQMLRLVASASPKGPKVEDDNTTRTPSEHPEVDLENHMLEESRPGSSDSDAQSDDPSSRSETSEHPLAGIIPPMIVIDNIEENFELENENDHRAMQRVKNVVPTRHVEATPDFVAALAIYTKGEQANGNNPSLFVPEDSAQPSHSPLASAKSQPLAVDNPEVSTSHEESGEGLVESKAIVRKAVIDASKERLVIDDRLIQLVSGPLSSLENESPASKLSRSSGTGSSSQNERFGSHLRSLSEASTVVAGSEKAEEMDVWVDGYQVDPPAGSSSVPSESNQGNIFSGLWNRSPARRARGKASPAAEDELSRRPSGHKRSASKSSSASSSDIEMAENEYEVVLQAPRTGKLGLVIRVIQCSEGLGPIVVQVKDYSPLLGKVLPGDRIVSIDGIRTTDMSLSEVTGMLPGRQASRWAIPVRLVVVRSRPPDGACAEIRHASLSHEGIEGNVSTAKDGTSAPRHTRLPDPVHKNTGSTHIS